MNFILKLYYGKYSLVKTYWVFNVIPSFFFGLLFGLMSFKSFPQDNHFLRLLILVFFICCGIISTVGLWRSSSNYQGNVVWKVLSKVVVIFNLAFFGGFMYTFLSGNIDSVYKVSLILILTLLFLMFEHYDPLENTESSTLYNISSNGNSSSHTTSSQSKSNHISDDVWEQTLIEFESNRKQGIWGRLFAENNGDENLAKAKYLNLRAKEIHDLRSKEIQESTQNNNPTKYVVWQTVEQELKNNSQNSNNGSNFFNIVFFLLGLVVLIGLIMQFQK